MKVGRICEIISNPRVIIAGFNSHKIFYSEADPMTLYSNISEKEKIENMQSVSIDITDRGEIIIFVAD